MRTSFCEEKNASACAALELSAQVLARRKKNNDRLHSGLQRNVDQTIGELLPTGKDLPSATGTTAPRSRTSCTTGNSSCRGAFPMGRRRPPVASPVGAEGDLLLMWWPNAEAFQQGRSACHEKTNPPRNAGSESMIFAQNRIHPSANRIRYWPLRGPT